MKVNLAGYLLKFVFAYIILFTIPISTAWAGEVENFITKLKTHYQKAPSLEVFSLDYHYLGVSHYQAWDYQAPQRYMALRMVEIDLSKEQFFENDIHHFAGGRTFNRIQFQNDKHSLFYDKNGIALGKRIIKQSMDSFQEIKGHIFMNIDFLAIKPLLEEQNITATIKLHHDKIRGKMMLSHKTSDNSEIDYVFSDNSLQLISINNKSQQKIYVYNDYQTTKGITFARSILKYYGGAINPTFIHRINQLNILEKIEPTRFKIPKEFGPIIPKNDKTLVSEKIAPDLYLVTDASASRNVLFKINDAEIMVFGAPVSPELAEQTIKLILNQFPNKKITSVYVTHPHSDHIAGLLAYTKRGIVIRADAYSISAIKAYPLFSKDISTFKFQTIKHNQVIDGVHFYVLENSHSKRQSFVHFKNAGIIYQADFLEVAFDNSIAKVIPNFTKTFIDFIRGKSLNFSRIVGHHRNNNISVEVMNKTYDAIL
jgi:phosphoribosyl 1,2-cyclic phosphodiesterase